MATLLALLAAALRKGQQQRYLPSSSIRNQDLESFLALRGQLPARFLGPQVPTAQNAAPATIPATLPGTAVGHVVTGASSSGAVGSAHDPSSHHFVQQPVGAKFGGRRW